MSLIAAVFDCKSHVVDIRLSQAAALNKANEQMMKRTTLSDEDNDDAAKKKSWYQRPGAHRLKRYPGSKKKVHPAAV